MEEKRDDALKNLKKISAILNEMDGVKEKIKKAKSNANAICKKISNKDKSLDSLLTFSCISVKMLKYKNIKGRMPK